MILSQELHLYILSAIRLYGTTFIHLIWYPIIVMMSITTRVLSDDWEEFDLCSSGIIRKKVRGDYSSIHYWIICSTRNTNRKRILLFLTGNTSSILIIIIIIVSKSYSDGKTELIMAKIHKNHRRQSWEENILQLFITTIWRLMRETRSERNNCWFRVEQRLTTVRSFPSYMMITNRTTFLFPVWCFLHVMLSQCDCLLYSLMWTFHIHL